ncbi:helix-turn-helix domain-containing protein [Candidatus Galacturonibacter soehngenii]|uniref:Helix-turn-helix transcriptional regulator n=1 Tax=Candidatus Galacturonatibacter soehngenii TaxID=2307010 RepID=A0A7V7QP50_9FIRM|nr:helix-turn-helix transcriptional regulator [Candidatus Galacturonibacter soehngenii]KAB1440958.1 helix-turn-helix transcriptional regulator [Candidatus Galacturonibacter soehngenii]MBA4688733.1 helix-turn-helix transcriptional regulator [Candidatus Galacturonibacter soehngenii]
MYEIFEQLLVKNNVSTYKVSKETGIAQSVFSSWKNGISNPKQDKLQKIADYFNVTVDYLMGIERDQNIDYYLNDETRKIAQEIFDTPELKTLLDLSKTLSPEKLKALTQFLKEFC